MTLTEQDESIEILPSHEVAAVVTDFDDFFAQHHQPIARALALTLHDDDLAAEAVAEGMTRAFQRWDDLAGYGNPPGWVYRVSLNWARSRRRRSWREVFRSEAADHSAVPGAEVDPGMADALAALPVEQRAVVVLRYLLDWSEIQTAEALQIPPGTVKSRLSRALDRLADVLKDNDDE